jgi:hypothetical protein
VNDFVNECRREWKRLGVPRSIANDMSAELGADLAEADSARDLLGDRASDPRRFAREWARERGIVPRRRGSRIAAALAVLALVPTIVGAVLLYSGSDSPTSATRIALVSPKSEAVTVWFPEPRTAASIQVMTAQYARDKAALRLQGDRLIAQDNGNRSNTPALALMIAGLAVLLPSTLLALRRPALYW